MNRKLLLFLFCGLFLTLTIYAQNPVASFTPSSTSFLTGTYSGCAPLVVIFNNTSTGVGPLQYNWTFGPTVSPPLSTTTNPEAIFTVAGTYNVTLTVKDANGVTNTSGITVITVLPTPIANFGATVTTGCYPLIDSFEDRSTAGSPTATLVSWSWSFGDGGTISGGLPTDESPKHTYTSAGLAPIYGFPVTLQVFNNYGCSGSTGYKTNSGYITIKDGILPNFIDSLTTNCTPRAYFTNTTNGGAPGLTYLWSFGDGGTSSAVSPNYAYSNPGRYTVNLTVSSTEGCTASDAQILNVPVGGVHSDFSYPLSVCVGVPVNFLNISTPNLISSTWNFGNGSTSTLIDPNPVSYAALGTDTITLANHFGTCNDTVIKTIQIVNSAVASFIALGNTISCKAPLTVSFMDQSSGNPNQWSWNFGDGSPLSNSQNPIHTYTTYGEFTVSLTVSSGSGCSGSVTQLKFVKVYNPFIKITNLPAYACGSLNNWTPTYIDTVVDGIQSFLWSFDNGQPSSNSPTPPAQNFGPGGYLVSVTITSNGGCATTYSDSIKVGVIHPTAGFTASTLTACTGSGVQFKDTSGGNPNQWSWDFGDGTIVAGINPAIDQNPSHGYSTPGKYTVKLIVYNNGCGDSTTILNYITVIGPVSKFSYSYNCTNQNEVQFNDLSIGPISFWSWNFGDGSPILAGSNPAIDQNPIHVYAGIGSDTVTLTVTGTGSCLSMSYQVLVSNQKFSFIAQSKIVCKNSPEQFSTLNYAGDSLYNFYYGDGDSSGWISYASPTHDYASTGVYNVKLKVIYENGCLDSLTEDSAVTVYGPSAGFSASNLEGCLSVKTQFTDTSKSDGLHNILTRVWDFSDGPPDTVLVTSLSHTYTAQGIYNVKLTVTDTYGCIDSSIQRNLVTVSVPQAQISGSDSSCPGSAMQFNNASVGGFNPTFIWNFGDGTAPVSGANPPSHTYAAVGTDTVKLSMVDMYGCTSDTINIITIGLPMAAFTVDTTATSCPPLIVHFKFTGGPYYSAFQWQFGDGGVNNDSLSVSNYYTKPGIDTAKLIVTSAGGCTSIADTVITIFGPTGTLSYSPLEGCDSLLVNLNVLSSGVTDYIWIFGDSFADSTTTSPSISHTYYPPITGQSPEYLPIVILQAPNGTQVCSVAQAGDNALDMILAIGVHPNFGVDKNLLCSSGTVQFSDSTSTNDTVANYIWDFGDGTARLNGMIPNPSHFYTSPGIYDVKEIVFTRFGCSDSILIPKLIKVVANPAVGISGANSQCVPATITFNGVILVPDTSTAFLKWNWNFYNGQAANSQNASQIYSLAGNDSVQLIATNRSMCSDTVVQGFSIFPLPVVTATADTTICLGQTLPLTASGAVSYTWQPPSNSSLTCTNCFNPIASPLNTISYIVAGTSTLGCVASDTIQVTVNLPVTVTVQPPSDSVCAGQTIQLTASGAAIYTWSPATGLSNPDIANPTANPTVTTLYQVIGSDNKSCFTDTKSVNVTVFNYPTLNLGPDATIPVGSSYQINGNGSSDIVSINWLPVTGLSCTNCLSPLASPINTTTYIASAANSGGCLVSDSIKITVICTSNNFFVPNTFSPNGDGVNDVFYVRGKGLNIIPSIIIFNRWGQIVFEKKDFAPNDPTAGWDGNFNGGKAPVDVYVYTLQLVCDNSTVISYNGNVALIR